MGGVTPHGIRYPDGASKAKNLGPELKVMAEDIDWYIGSYLSPTGPIRQIIIGVAEEVVPPVVREVLPPLLEEYLEQHGYVRGADTIEPAIDDAAWRFTTPEHLGMRFRLPLGFKADGHLDSFSREVLGQDLVAGRWDAYPGWKSAVLGPNGQIIEGVRDDGTVYIHRLETGSDDGGDGDTDSRDVGATWARASFMMAKRRTGRGRALVLGSSTPEGAGAPTQAARFIDQMGLRLNEFPDYGHPAYRTRFWPAIQQGNSVPDPVRTGDAVQESSAESYGPGGRAVWLGESGTVTFTVVGSHARVMYARTPGAGSPTISIDGGSATSLGSWAGTLAVGQFTDWISLGSLGSHTVTISSNGTTASLAGIEVRQSSADLGVTVVDHNRSGSDANYWVDNSRRALQAATVAAFEPDLLILVGMGSNSYWGQSASPSQVAAWVRQMIDTFAGDADVLLVGNHDRGPAPGGVTWEWREYINAQKNIARSDPRVGFVDMSARMPPMDDDPFGVYADIAHPNAIGHVWYSDAVAGFIRDQTR